MARITVEDCIDKFESRFELVLVASNRARKLHSGDNPTVERDNDKNTVIALREIADETITIDNMKNSLIEEFQTVSPQNEEDLSIEQNDSEDQNSYQDDNLETSKNENEIFETIETEETSEELENNEDRNAQSDHQEETPAESAQEDSK